MKTFFGYDGHFDLEEMYDFLPEIKILTAVIVVGFILLHGLSGKLEVAKCGYLVDIHNLGGYLGLCFR